MARCMKEGRAGAEPFAVDASMIVADANRRRGVAKAEDLDPTVPSGGRGVSLVLNDAAFGAATPTEPKIDLADRSGGPLRGRSRLPAGGLRLFATTISLT